MPSSRHASKRTYRSYTDEDIIKLVAEKKSVRQVLISLGVRPVGGNYANLYRNIHRLGLDTSHWTGQACRVGQQKNWSEYTKNESVKPHVINRDGYQCSNKSCGISEWLGNKIVLELDHIDGDRTNSEGNNLRLLCPNCHSQTPTWRNKKR